jgi:hypothetical protein
MLLKFGLGNLKLNVDLIKGLILNQIVGGIRLIEDWINVAHGWLTAAGFCEHVNEPVGL